jgi:ribosome-associated toxin RatA of RatAB toxin-antitoxin module
MREIRRSALVAVPASRMFALINDIESYPLFVPGCQAASVLEQGAAMLRARLTVGSGALRTSFVTRNQLVQDRSVQMDLEEGPFRSLTGQWTIEPVAGAQGDAGCSVQLVLRFELQRGLAGLAMGPLIERMAGSLVDAFVARARQGVVAGADTGAAGASVAGEVAVAGAAGDVAAAASGASDRST